MAYTPLKINDTTQIPEPVTFTDDKKNNIAFGVQFFYGGKDIADYGGGFSTYTPPTAQAEYEVRYVEDTNATTPGKRLYIYLNDAGGWVYITLG